MLPTRSRWATRSRMSRLRRTANMLAVKFPAHKAALLDIAADGKVTYNKYDIATGLWPYNVDFTPDGKLAMTAGNGGAGYADGNIDTISIIDMTAHPCASSTRSWSV